jgi:hypothetical protein
MSSQTCPQPRGRVHCFRPMAAYSARHSARVRESICRAKHRVPIRCRGRLRRQQMLAGYRASFGHPVPKWWDMAGAPGMAEGTRARFLDPWPTAVPRRPGFDSPRLHSPRRRPSTYFRFAGVCRRPARLPARRPSGTTEHCSVARNAQRRGERSARTADNATPVASAYGDHRRCALGGAMQ